MSKMNNLQKALIMVEDESIDRYEAELAAEGKHEFSESYFKRRKEIIEKSYDKSFAPLRAKQYNTKPRRLHLRTMLVAAIIMLLATLSVIAITKPHIYYVIKEKKDSWRITFAQEDSSDEASLVPVIPMVPDSFSIIEEELTEAHYYLVMENKGEHMIIYEQMLPNAASINIDSERNENTIELINGSEVICSRKGEATMLLINDSRYIYQISGTASEKLLREIAESIMK